MGQKTNLGKYKRTQILPSVFSDHNGFKLENDNKGKRKMSRHLEAKPHTTKQFMHQKEISRGKKKKKKKLR